ncbi:plastin-1 isoform X1 [Hydra vulgaris]|uniref:plastin-1 isoform X1 n=1 Tax=Hydra vulgaris TaxID=6087 RepID=UPI0032E9CF52
MEDDFFAMEKNSLPKNECIFAKDKYNLPNGESLPKDIVRDVEKVFYEFNTKFDKDGNGHITSAELADVFEKLGENVPGYKIRELIAEVDENKNGTIEFDEFLQIYCKVTNKGVFGQWTSLLSPRQGIKTSGGTSTASADGTAHTFSESEQTALRDWINSQLKDDPDLKTVIPIQSNDLLFKSLRDGIILCKMINLSVKDTIDERVINKGPLNPFLISENNSLAINSANAIGCTVVNIGPEDISGCNQHLVLGLLWQIIRIGLFASITLQGNYHLTALLEVGETIEALLNLTPEELLLRWVNYHLRRSGSDTKIKNFSTDIKDSEAYALLLYQISPQEYNVDRPEYILSFDNLMKRADMVIKNADKIGCKKFISARDIPSGNAKLNIAFVANLFNVFPALDGSDIEHVEIENYVETREEKTYRSWMNSMGVTPYVYHLYNDLSSGIVLFQLYDTIRRNTVDWSRVNKAPFKVAGGKMKKVENCNYVIELGKANKYSLVGIGGEDIHNGNNTLILALVWQMLRDYTICMLSKLTKTGDIVKESEIIEWVNKKLRTAGKRNLINSFKDPSIATSHAVIDLVDSIKPNSIQYNLVTKGESKEEQKLNAHYAISMCRKIGARTYAIAEDLMEVKPKMVLTVFACLMTRGLQLST